MNNWGIEDEVTSSGNTEQSGPKALRDAYDALKQKNQELQDGLASIQKDLQMQKVQSTLSELGIPNAAAEQYKGDADPEKVREWAVTMKSIFGGGAEIPSTPSGNATHSVTIDDDTAQQFQRMNEAGQSGSPLGNAEAAMNRVADATDIQSLLAAWSGMK